MEAKLGPNCVLVPTESQGAPYVRMSIDQIFEANEEQRCMMVNGGYTKDGRRRFFAVFTQEDADFKITVTNESNRNVALIYETPVSGLSPYVYRPGQTWSLSTLDPYNNDQGFQGNLHFTSQDLPSAMIECKKYQEKQGISADEASQITSQINVHFWREISSVPSCVNGRTNARKGQASSPPYSQSAGSSDANGMTNANSTSVPYDNGKNLSLPSSPNVSHIKSLHQKSRWDKITQVGGRIYKTIRTLTRKSNVKDPSLNEDRSGYELHESTAIECATTLEDELVCRSAAPPLGLFEDEDDVQIPISRPKIGSRGTITSKNRVIQPNSIEDGFDYDFDFKVNPFVVELHMLK